MRIQSKQWAAVAAIGLMAICTGRAWGWNATGHQIISWIAWQELTPEARDKATELLKSHPDYVELLTKEKTPADQRDVEAFLTASYWPDLVRTPNTPRSKYNHPVWHYADFPYVQSDLPANAGKLQAPVSELQQGADPLNSIQAFEKNMLELKDEKRDPSDRAIALCWILHLAGDTHQPLHGTSLFSAEFPTGDRGGNEFLVQMPEKAMNLHAVWDGMFGDEMALAAIRKSGERLMKKHSRSDLAGQIQVASFEQWTRESFEAAKKSVYLNGNLKGQVAGKHKANPALPVPALPQGYMEQAMEVADERAALAGYRLADQLNAALGQPHAGAQR